MRAPNGFAVGGHWRGRLDTPGATGRVVSLLLAGVFAALAPAAGADAPIRVWSPTAAPASRPGDDVGLRAAEAARERRLRAAGGRALGGAVAPVPDSLDAVWLDDSSRPFLERGEPIGAVELASLVRERGRSLVVTGRAVGARPGDADYGRLIGRREGEPAAFRADRPAVAVLEQAAPVTECLTHFLAEGLEATGAGAPGVRVLAARRAAWDGGKWLPVVWERRVGRGKVIVVALRERRAGSGSGSGSGGGAGAGAATAAEARALLDVLVARALQVAAGRRVVVALPARLPLAAWRLGPGDLGLVPGVAPRAGFFRGRRIAPVMSARGADWLLRPEREAIERPEEVLDRLGLREGDQVADIGAGVGYFSLRLARRVGPRGRVFAVDIQEEMLRRLRARAARAGVENVVAVLASETDPGISGPLDLALMVDVYHELQRPARVIAAARAALAAPAGGRRAGRLVLVEYRGEDPRVPIRPLHRMSEDQARAELRAMGFRWVRTHEFLRQQRVIVFTPAEVPAKAPRVVPAHPRAATPR